MVYTAIQFHCIYTQPFYGNLHLSQRVQHKDKLKVYWGIQPSNTQVAQPALTQTNPPWDVNPLGVCLCSYIERILHLHDQFDTRRQFQGSYIIGGVIPNIVTNLAWGNIPNVIISVGISHS